MTSYDIQILICQECQEQFSFWDIGSCNTFGAKFFTDGSIIGPMYDPGQILIECPHCCHIFRPDEKILIDEMKDSSYFGKDARRVLKSCHSPSYMKAISLELWRTKQEEKAIRIRAWQESNTRHKLLGHSLKNKCDESARANLKALILILDDDQDEELIMKAESYRHLGKFQVAINILQERSISDEYKNWRDLVLKLAVEGKTEVSVW